jgi:hypothetical protein
VRTSVVKTKGLNECLDDVDRPPCTGERGRARRQVDGLGGGGVEVGVGKKKLLLSQAQNVSSCSKIILEVERAREENRIN